MHLTCTGITRETADDLLAEAAQAGIRSILALRGDPAPSANGKWQSTVNGFQNAGELVKHIRSKHGAFFSIAVAGHPLGHAASTSPADELKYLKAKVDAGADYIITQMLFKASEYTQYVQACRAEGITCPIVPGILMVPPSAEMLRQVTSHCGVEVPQELLAVMAAAGTDSEAVRIAGRKYMEGLCKEILAGEDAAPGLYIYTMNLEKSATELVAALRLQGLEEEEEAVQRQLPFANPRDNEKVRPIFWASNPVSYLARTRGWVNDLPQHWKDAEVVSRDGGKFQWWGGGARELVLEAPSIFDEDVDGVGGGQGVRYSYHSIVARRLGSQVCE